MEFIRQIASLWNEFFMIGISSGIIGCIFMSIVAVLAGKLKLISSMVVSIPTAVCMGVSKITFYIAIFLGIIQLALKLL